MKDNCIFCKLANGVFPTNSIYEDEDFNVILDADPATRGHALIIPKEHFDDLISTPEKILNKALPLAKKIAIKQKDALGCDGINIVQNNGAEAGQTVFHLHIHVIPRYKGKDTILTWTHESFSEEEYAQIKENLMV